MTFLYIFLIGLGGTLVLSGVYNTPYIATIQSILANKPLSIGGSGNAGADVTPANINTTRPPFPTNPGQNPGTGPH